MSNLKVGGALQVAISFLNQLKKMKNSHMFIIVVSTYLKDLIDINTFPSNFVFYIAEDSPAKVNKRKKITRFLDKIVNYEKVDIVFSVFGPSYWKPKVLHIMGIADGWIYNPDSIAFKQLRLHEYLKMRLISLYKAYYIKRDANYFIVETDDAKKKLNKYLHVNMNSIYVVGNCLNSIFYDSSFLDITNKYYVKLPCRELNEFRLVYIAYPYPNKNHIIINDVIKLLKKEKINLKLILTLPESFFKKIFDKEVQQNIINLGVIPIYSCPSVYSQCDALFFPSLLETFSSSFLEAMYMKLPILTSGIDFAISVCGDAALYFNPLSPNDIAEKIIYLYRNNDLKEELKRKGEKRFRIFHDDFHRALHYIKIIESIIR